MLSLDCFDTLLWRRGQAPKDVFCDLPVAGGAIQRRMAAEGRMRIARGCEVTLDEIYRALMPNADEDARFAAMQAELDAEAAHCFAYEPIVQLMAAAKARGLMTMIVSDTYLNAGQLIDLIERAGGERVIALIDPDFLFVGIRHAQGRRAVRAGAGRAGHRGEPDPPPRRQSHRGP